MNEFTFFWLDGKRDVLKGADPANALNRAGYQRDAIAALDFWSSGDNRSWKWNDNLKTWVKK